MTYHEHTDAKYSRNIRLGAPAAHKAFLEFDKAAMRGEDKVIPRKETELIAVAIALTTQCPYCIEAHTKAAQKEGATEQEIAETVMIATAMRAGAGFAHGFMAMKFFDEAEGHQH